MTSNGTCLLNLSSMLLYLVSTASALLNPCSFGNVHDSLNEQKNLSAVNETGLGGSALKV